MSNPGSDLTPETRCSTDLHIDLRGDTHGDGYSFVAASAPSTQFLMNPASGIAHSLVTGT